MRMKDTIAIVVCSSSLQVSVLLGDQSSIATKILILLPQILLLHPPQTPLLLAASQKSKIKPREHYNLVQTYATR